MKKIARVILFPPNWFRCLFGFTSMGALICVFRMQLQRSTVGYIIYLFSALGLYYLISGMILPLIRKTKALLWKNKYVRRYIDTIANIMNKVLHRIAAGSPVFVLNQK